MLTTDKLSIFDVFIMSNYVDTSISIIGVKLIYELPETTSK